MMKFYFSALFIYIAILMGLQEYVQAIAIALGNILALLIRHYNKGW